ncbi:MAG: hypothetical protein SV375_12555, partial [Thermodesulfobacteriota bacterium]|nr:hypothetical protein [Thermodesulfobacteriota bacterium]
MAARVEAAAADPALAARLIERLMRSEPPAEKGAEKGPASGEGYASRAVSYWLQRYERCNPAPGNDQRASRQGKRAARMGKRALGKNERALGKDARAERSRLQIEQALIALWVRPDAAARTLYWLFR